MAKQQSDRLRSSIANEAARIIHASGYVDYNAARNKAALRLGCRDRKSLPNNCEIEQALIEYQQLFHADEQKLSANHLRQLALEAMDSLEQFSPRVTGPILSGNVNQHSKLQIHLFSDSPEQIALHLLDKGIPYQESETTLSFKKGQKQRQPCFRFQYKETEVEIIWFQSGSIGQPPLSSIDQKPEKRASLTQLRKLIY